MSEQRQAGAAPPVSADAAGAPEIGLPEVDSALAEIGELERRPVGEHLGVFERAQEGLRGALESPADDSR